MLLDEDLYRRITEKKEKLDSLRPLSKRAVNKLRKQFAVELAYNSNAIEGNTLTLRETRLVIEEGITVKGKSLREHLEARNHQEAFEFLEELVNRESKITEKMIKDIHRAIMTGIDDEDAGKYRRANVRILGTAKKPPGFEKVPQRMKEYVDYINKNPENLNPVELAAMVHYRLVEIHPFIDGNGRCARLIMNLFLMQRGYPVTTVLKVDRKKYYDRLKKADQGDLKSFVDFTGRCIERSLALYLDAFTPGSEYIDLAEASRDSPYSQEYLSLLARKGKIEAIKLGRKWFTTKEAVEKYIRSKKR